MAKLPRKLRRPRRPPHLPTMEERTWVIKLEMRRKFTEMVKLALMKETQDEKAQ